MADIDPMIDDDGEVRELTAADVATFERGAPWAKLDEYQRLQRVEAAAQKLLAKHDRPHLAEDETWYNDECEALRAALTR
jgi:hypothetical protein